MNLVGHHFPVEFVGDAMAILERESRGDPDALNPSGASGLFQIKPLYWGFLLEEGESLFDPEPHIRVASIIVESSIRQGLDPWHCWACMRILLSPPSVERRWPAPV